MMLAALEFLVPAFLAGAAAASVPLIIHLIHRRRTRVVDFSTLRFLRLVEKRIARRRRIENWWILALRITMLVFLATALASPVLRGAGYRGGLARARVLVIDNSYSMDLVDGGSSHLERARAAARALLDELEGGDFAAVTPLHPTPSEVRLFRDIGRSFKALAAVKPSPGNTPLDAAVRPALEALLDAPTSRRELIILSDLQATGARPLVEEGALEGLAGKVRVVVMQPPARKVKNLTIASADAIPEPGGRGRGHRVVVTVLNPGDFDAAAKLTLRVDGKTAAARPVALAAGATTECALEVSDPGPGAHPASVALTRDDLAADDVRHFVIHGRRTRRVLVARDSVSHIPRLDPAYYLVRALRPGGDGMLEPTLCRTEELARFDLDEYAVVILADPARVPPAVAPVLFDYLRSGGGLLLVCGPTLDPEAMNRLEVKLDGDREPRPLEIVFGSPISLEGNGATSLTLGDFDRRHPVLRDLFTLTPPVDLTTPRFYRHVALEPREGGAPSVIARFSNGRPALVESRIGRGRLLVFATTLNPEWNDFPYKVSFLPFVHALVHALARDGRRKSDWVVLEPVVLHYPPGMPAPHRLILTGHGLRREQVPASTGRAAEATLGPLPEPGHYTLVERSAGSDRPRVLVANVDPEESDLRRIEARELPAEVIPLSTPEAAVAAVADPGTGFSLGLPLLAAALLCLLAEGVLAARVTFGGSSS